MVDFPKPQRLGEMFGWGDNPFYKTFDANRNAVIQGFSNIGSNPLNPGAGFSQGFAQGSLMDQQRAEEEQQQFEQQGQTNATRAWLEQQGYNDLIPLVEAGQADIAFGEALKRMQPGYGQSSAPAPMEINGQLVDPMTGQVLGDYRDAPGTAGSTEYGLTPIWGQLPDGSFGYGVQGKDGTFRRVDTGDLSPLDPRSLAGERAYGGALGGAQGQAAAAAPSDISTAEIALGLIKQIKDSPELPWATGTSAGLGGNAIPGTGRYGFQNLVDQAKSGAFLSAIQEMRGMGALSNAEGQTATQAITRMNTALSQADFVKALEDYERIVTIGMQRAQGRIGAGPNVGSLPSANPQVLTYNPATGMLE